MAMEELILSDPNSPTSARRQVTQADRTQQVMGDIRQEGDAEGDLLRQAMNQYYDTRSGEIDQMGQQRIQSGMEQIGVEGRIQETQDRFARAGTGNVAGTRRATQQGLLQRALQMRTGQLHQDVLGQQHQQQMDLEGSRAQDLIGTYRDPLEGAAYEALMQGIQASTQGVQAQTQMRINLNEIYSRYNQQMGSYIGSGIKNAGDAYYTSYTMRR